MRHATLSLLLALVLPATAWAQAAPEADSFMRFNLPAPLLTGSPGGGDTPPPGGVENSVDLLLEPAIPALVEQGAAYAGSLTGINGTGPYTFSHAGTLPQGILRNGASVSGNFLAIGPQALEVGVLDADGNPASRTFAFEVMAPHRLSYDRAEIHARVGYPVEGPSPTVTGARDGHEVAIASGTMPFALSPSGEISGTPSGAGSGTVTLRSVDGMDRPSNDRQLAWTVHPEITVNPIADMAVTKTLPFTSPAPVANGTHGAVTWSLAEGELPDGLSLAANGRVTGTPTADAVDSDGIRLAVADALGTTPQLSAPFAVSVAPAPPPVAQLVGYVSGTLSGNGTASFGPINGLQPGDLLLFLHRGSSGVMPTWSRGSGSALTGVDAQILGYRRATQQDVDNGFSATPPAGTAKYMVMQVAVLAYRNAGDPVLDRAHSLSLDSTSYKGTSTNLTTPGERLIVMSFFDMGGNPGGYFTFRNDSGLQQASELFDRNTEVYLDYITPQRYYAASLAAYRGILPYGTTPSNPFVGIRTAGRAFSPHYVSLLIPGVAP